MPVTVREIIAFFPPIKFVGNEDCFVEKIIQLDPGNTNESVLCWCNAKNIGKIKNIKTGTVIIPSETSAKELQQGCNYIFTDNPRQYFNEVLSRFFWTEETESSISENAVISRNVKLGLNPFIADGVAIKENCVIGDNVKILNNTIIYSGTVIEDNVVIGANNVIGNYGFGYEKNKEDNYVLMPHIGNVVIRSNVEIGNCNCIDRAVLGSTIIGKHTKIHNFVQVAHGVEVGENCLITANVTISGSTIIGNRVWFGPGVTVSNKLSIGDFAYLSMGAVVLVDVPNNATVSGNPGRIIKSQNNG